MTFPCSTCYRRLTPAAGAFPWAHERCRGTPTAEAVECTALRELAAFLNRGGLLSLRTLCAQCGRYGFERATGAGATADMDARVLSAPGWTLGFAAGTTFCVQARELVAQLTERTLMLSLANDRPVPCVLTHCLPDKDVMRLLGLRDAWGVPRLDAKPSAELVAMALKRRRCLECSEMSSERLLCARCVNELMLEGERRRLVDRIRAVFPTGNANWRYWVLDGAQLVCDGVECATCLAPGCVIMANLAEQTAVLGCCGGERRAF